METIESTIALPLIGINSCTPLGELMHMTGERLCVGALCHPQPYLTTLSTDRAKYRRPGIDISATAFALIGTATGWV